MPTLTKYERVCIISARVRQLDAGADAAVTPHPDDTIYDIAVRELESGVMPIRLLATLCSKP
jgi:DNA-directed RNA polymerase subunit K/omega